MSDANVLQAPQAAAKLNQEGKFREALALVAPIVEKGEKQANAYIQMSRALRGLKDAKAARDIELRSVEMFPENQWVAMHVGNLFVASDKDFAKAAEIVAPHLKAGRNDPGLFSIASMALRALQRNAEADTIELRALEVYPDNAQLHARRAAALNGVGRFADVAALLAGKTKLVEASEPLKAQLKRAEEGLAQAKAKPAATTPVAAAATPAAKPAAPVVTHSPAPTAVKPATQPSAIPKEAPRPAAQAAPTSEPAKTAASPSIGSPQPAAKAAAEAPPVQAKSAALGSIQSVPASPPQAPKAPATPVAPVPTQRAAEAPRVEPRATAASPSSTTPSSATVSRAAPTPQAPPVVARAPTQTTSPAARAAPISQTARPVERRTGISGFSVLLLGLLVVAAGLIGSHFAGLIDLTPFVHQISMMIEAAQSK